MTMFPGWQWYYTSGHMGGTDSQLTASGNLKSPSSWDVDIPTENRQNNILHTVIFHWIIDNVI